MGDNLSYTVGGATQMTIQKKGKSMNRISLSVFIVLTLIFIDASISVSYAKSKITIFKVTKVSPKHKLHLRAWPSTKSRVKKSLPYNAKDLTETGKSRIIGKTKWMEVNWKNTRGWVNARFLKKTGVLLHANKSSVKMASPASRNTKSTRVAKTKEKMTIRPVISNENLPPQSFGGDRYDQPVPQLASSEVRTAYKGKPSNKLLNCSGKTPNRWDIKLNMSNKKMIVKLKHKKSFNVPIKYHEWASPTKLRMNLGGERGRNIVDVNLEKTDACNNGLSKINFTYQINATINRQFYSGCCAVVSQ